VGTEDINVNIKLTYQGSTEAEDITGLTVKPDGEAIDIFQGTGLVGTVNGNELLFYYEVDGGTFEFKARK
jgi:hypothetical protein